MAEDNPIEKMIRQIADMYTLIKEYKGQEISANFTPELRERLENVKIAIETFAKLNKEMFASAGISEEDLKNLVENPPETLDKRTREAIEFSKNLKKEIESDRLRLSLSEGAQRPASSDEKTKSSANQRKKKFKRVGGDGDWIPL